MPLSDDDIWGSSPTAGATASAPAAPALSDDDIWGGPKSAEANSFGSDVASAAANRVAGLQSDPSILHTMGQGFGFLNDVAGQAVKRVPGYNTASDAMHGAAKSTADAIDTTSPGRWLGDKLSGVSDDVSDAARNYPMMASRLGDVANIVAGAQVGTAGAGAARGAGNIAADAMDAQRMVSGPSITAPSAKAVSALDEMGKNHKFISGINDSLNKMKGITDDTGKTVGGYGEIYDKAKESSNGVDVKAPAAKDNVDALLDDMGGDLTHKTEQGSSQAYRDLQAVSDAFDNDGNIPLDKVTLLKRRLNDLYSPDMGSARGEIYSRLNRQVNNIIKQARKENPDWADMMDAGNNLFLNYKNTSDSLSKAWSIGDKKSFEDALSARENDPYSAPPTADVRQKISDIAKPATVQQYEDTLRVLPKDLHDEYSKAVLENNPSNKLLVGAIKSIYKASKGNYYGAANQAYNSSIGNAARRIDPEIAVKYPHISDALDYHSKKAQSAFDNFVANQYESQNPTRLALPAPKYNYAGNKDLLDYGWDKNAADIAAKKQAEIDAGHGVINSTKPSIGDMINEDRHPDDIGEFGRALLDSLSEKRARGGSIGVHREPTDAQKIAGNYKKHHVRIHGLDISIENPRGSERSGRGKDGKEWRSTMPDHYGYIKRTAGADGDHMDVYIGDNPKSNRVYVIDQKHHENGSFDEHKVMLGYSSRESATKAYRDAFSDKKNRIMKITRITIPEFKAWLKSGDTGQPFTHHH